MSLLREKRVNAAMAVRMALRGSIRQLEDVERSRQGAGWSDDDVAMKRYNQGIYCRNYFDGDDMTECEGQGITVGSTNTDYEDDLGGESGKRGFIMVLAFLVSVGVATLAYRLIRGPSSSSSTTNKSSEKERSSSRRKGSVTSRRSRSKSARRSRSRSRSRKGHSNYDLMDDDRSRKSTKSIKSVKSSRSQRPSSRSQRPSSRSQRPSSRSQRPSRSRSRAHSRSRSKSRREAAKETLV